MGEPIKICLCGRGPIRIPGLNAAFERLRNDLQDTEGLEYYNGRRDQHGLSSPTLEITLKADDSCPREADTVETYLARVFEDRREITWGKQGG